ncbi:YkvA family protein [Clostridium oryzae]|uniref:DUF1232 domain-containing protein n=1 Tax=Clostridium oryzae TaxID=1450648 RepID=A0A1V4IVN6_9CLOT|nr:YkvA family protein [Clostridium oryzae]OPJ63959.1 hypothetical protein CLORY_08310 [Clostridium oryzae]
MKNKFTEMLSHSKLAVTKTKKEVGALYFAYRRKDVPLYAKLMAMAVVGYALSPLDLIPDFIPILGYLDDLILIPLGVTIAVKLIPKNIMKECRLQAEEAFSKNKHKNWIAGAVIIIFWVLIIMYILSKII